MDKQINVTLQMNKAQSRLIRRLLDNEERRLVKQLWSTSTTDAEASRLELELCELRTIENSIFLDELESEKNQSYTMDSEEFKESLNIGKFKKTDDDPDAPILADYSLVVGGETYYFVNHGPRNWRECRWSLIDEECSECYCYNESRKSVLESLFTSLYLQYRKKQGHKGSSSFTMPNF